MTAASRKVAPEGVQTGGAEPWAGGPGAGKPEAAEPEAAERSAGKPGAAPPPRPRRAPSGPERQRDADRSRRALLDAALEEFSLRGFAGARVADIARRAGVNKQLINYYFGSKEGLYLALQRAWLEREESFAPPEVPLPDLVVRYLLDALADPRSLRLLLWRGLADGAAPDGGPGRQPDQDRVGRRQAAGEVAADLDPAAVLLAGMGMVAAPIAMPQIARELFGVDPSSAEFRERYAEQLRRITAYLSGDPRGHAHASDPSGPTRSSNGQPPDTQPPNTQPPDTQPSDTQPLP
jgi:TetR/AcrR family transcriptional regulator